MNSNTTRREVQVRNETGLHLRLASQFAQTASHFQSDVRVRFGSETANGKSILGLLTLGAGRDARVDLEARGADADLAIAALAQLVASWTRMSEELGSPGEAR